MGFKMKIIESKIGTLTCMTEWKGLKGIIYARRLQACKSDPANGLGCRSRAARQQLAIHNRLSAVDMLEKGRCISCKRTLPVTKVESVDCWENGRRLHSPLVSDFGAQDDGGWR